MDASLVLQSSGVRCAVKVIDRRKLAPEGEAAVKEEVNILSSLKHPHVIAFRDFFEDAHTYYIVTELCEGGELFQALERKVGRLTQA